MVRNVARSKIRHAIMDFLCACFIHRAKWAPKAWMRVTRRNDEKESADWRQPAEKRLREWPYKVAMKFPRSNAERFTVTLIPQSNWCLRKLHDVAASIDFFIVGCRFMNSMWTGYFLARVNKSQAIPLNGNCSSKDLETWSQGALIIEEYSRHGFFNCDRNECLDLVKDLQPAWRH